MESSKIVYQVEMHRDISGARVIATTDGSILPGKYIYANSVAIERDSNKRSANYAPYQNP